MSERLEVCGETMRKILVVQVQQAPTIEYLQRMRDYVLESLRNNVLILGAGMTYRMEAFPNLAGVMVAEDPSFSEESENNILKESSVMSIAGPGGREKAEILSRLKAYRTVHGLGCLDAVAKGAGRNVTASMLRDLLVGAAKLELSDWRKIGQSLDRLMKKESNCE